MSRILAAGAARMKLEAGNYEARIAALEAQLAELAAENERLNEGWDHTSKMLGATNARAYEAEKALNEALSRTGAVKVDRQALNLAISKWVTDSDLHVTVGDIEALHVAILSALSPAAPEGRQEAVAWEVEGTGSITNSKYQLESWEMQGVDGIRPLYTRTSEQAVTEALRDLVIRAQAILPDHYVNWHRFADDALKAAMEAGG